MITLIKTIDYFNCEKVFTHFFIKCLSNCYMEEDYDKLFLLCVMEIQQFSYNVEGMKLR